MKHNVILVVLDGLNYEVARHALGHLQAYVGAGRAALGDPHDDRVYAAARSALDGFVAQGTLRRDAEPSLYVYRQEMDGRVQTGVVGCVHIDDYERDVIRKHEKTRQDKEDDRTRHVLTLNANAEPVFLTYRGRPDINALAESITRTAPLYDFGWASLRAIRNGGIRTFAVNRYAVFAQNALP